jgi:hypothetical protein
MLFSLLLPDVMRVKVSLIRLLDLVIKLLDLLLPTFEEFKSSVWLSFDSILVGHKLELIDFGVSQLESSKLSSSYEQQFMNTLIGRIFTNAPAMVIWKKLYVVVCKKNISTWNLLWLCENFLGE